jgi:hypothetical protein
VSVGSAGGAGGAAHVWVRSRGAASVAAVDGMAYSSRAVGQRRGIGQARRVRLVCLVVRIELMMGRERGRGSRRRRHGGAAARRSTMGVGPLLSLAGRATRRSAGRLVNRTLQRVRVSVQAVCGRGRLVVRAAVVARSPSRGARRSGRCWLAVRRWRLW